MRKSGDGGPTKVVEIPIDQGIRAYATGYQIGPQPRIMQNLVWTARFGGRYLGFPRGVSPISPFATLTDKGDPAHTNQYLLGLGYYESTNGVLPLAIGAFDTSLGAIHLGLWDVLANSALHGAGTVSVADTDLTERIPAAWAYWGTQGVFYYSHANANGDIRQWDGVTESTYAVLGSITSGSPQASALAIHLDRLWMAVPYSTSAIQPNALEGGWAKTLVFFTDPFDPTTIRPGSFLAIPDQVRCMFRTTIGDLDASAQSHLVFGCRNSIWVLDGDPRAGNAVLRQLSNGVGILASSLVAETQYGAFFLATDGELYLLPPGASTMQPLGTPVRSLLSSYANIPRTTAPSSLLWTQPHLYVFGDVTGEELILDATIPSGMIWTGPHNATSTANVLGALRVPEGQSTAETLLIAERGGMHVFEVGTDATLRRQKLQSGYISEPGHDVMLQRIILLTTRTVATDMEVTAHTPEGQIHVLAKASPTATTLTPDQDLVAKTVYRPTRGVVRGDFFFVQVNLLVVGAEMNLQRFLVEYRVVPKQDSESGR